MKKAGKWILAVFILLLAAALALGGVFFTQRRAFLDSELTMGTERDISLVRQEDGSVAMSWAGDRGEDRYFVEVRPADAPEGGEALFSALCSEPACLLPSYLPQRQELELRVYARSRWEMLGREEVRLCADPLIETCCLALPAAEGLTVTVDQEKQEAVLSWSGTEGDGYRLYACLEGEEPRLLETLTGEGCTLRFGEGDALPVPERGEKVSFWLEAFREQPGLRYPGGVSEAVAVTREDFLGVTLGLVCEALDDSSWRLTWQETKGESYLVLGQEEGGEWRTLAEIPAGVERVYLTGHLAPFTGCRYRVEVRGGQAEGSGAVAPEEAAVSTGATLAFAAAWGLEELDLFADPEGREKIGTLPPDRAACVLGEENGYLLVGTPQGSAYLKSDRCMIDLPDYIGDLCEYRITNSVSSIYTVHGYLLENMTGTVIPGYEAVALPDGGYLVPLLYPTAQKLIAAALALREDGYRLRIYDSFRPHLATRYVYDQALELMEKPVSEEEDAPTYGQVMTGDRYSLWDFLAAGISKHNRGIAVDVELLHLEDGTALKMQSEIHDLSWHASTANNDASAGMLADYMRTAGFGTLFSEWWHFQDMDTLNTLEPPYRREGVTPEGWRADDRGWRYRCADGSFLAGETREIDGVRYTFGEDGYILEQTGEEHQG
jgi:D-alanyl-D-alanine dipeptidase